MYVYIQACKTRQFGKNSEVGIHIQKPTNRELELAVERAASQGFTCIYVYDSSKTIVDLADMLDGTGYNVGWSAFCLTLPAFKIDLGAY